MVRRTIASSTVCEPYHVESHTTVREWTARQPSPPLGTRWRWSMECCPSDKSVDPEIISLSEDTRIISVWIPWLRHLLPVTITFVVETEALMTTLTTPLISSVSKPVSPPLLSLSIDTLITTSITPQTEDTKALASFSSSSHSILLPGATSSSSSSGSDSYSTNLNSCSGPFHIFIQTSYGKMLEIEVTTLHTLCHLQSMIWSKVGIPTDQQCILFEGRHLTDREVYLCEYGIHKNSILHLHLRPHPGTGYPWSSHTDDLHICDVSGGTILTQLFDTELTRILSLVHLPSMFPFVSTPPFTDHPIFLGMDILVRRLDQLGKAVHDGTILFSWKEWFSTSPWSASFLISSLPLPPPPPPPPSPPPPPPSSPLPPPPPPPPPHSPSLSSFSTSTLAVFFSSASSSSSSSSPSSPLSPLSAFKKRTLLGENEEEEEEKDPSLGWKKKRAD